ncbi:MAG: SDR family oxidoreductase [Myxococcota bacterium]|jgi:3-dehydrosphinganine reductase|nr:SDR family oxidoreductase [Myxococcota bacterium]
MHRLEGKRVIVTGGSSGIGLAATRLLLAAKARVAIVARSQNKLDEAAKELRSLFPDATLVVHAMDVSDQAAVQASVPILTEALGGLDILINNAGVAHPSRFLETEAEVFEKMMRINYFGVVNMCRAFAPVLVEQRHGQICNVSSLLGFMGIFGYSAYAASKFAVNGFSECLRQDLLPYNISVSVLFPPDTDTPQLAEENKIKPPETKAISGNVKVLSAEQVARVMLKGLVRRRFHLLPGFGSHFTFFMARHFPALVRWFIDADLKKWLKRSGAQAEKSG